MPVTLPPGWAKIRREFDADEVVANCDNGNRRRCFMSHERRRVADSQEQVSAGSQKLGEQRGVPLRLPFSIAQIDDKIPHRGCIHAWRALPSTRRREGLGRRATRTRGTRSGVSSRFAPAPRTATRGPFLRRQRIRVASFDPFRGTTKATRARMLRSNVRNGSSGVLRRPPVKAAMIIRVRVHRDQGRDFSYKPVQKSMADKPSPK